jgi:hypothetical protein
MLLREPEYHVIYGGMKDEHKNQLIITVLKPEYFGYLKLE